MQWPTFGKRNKNYEEGTVVQVPKPERPGSDQEKNYVGELNYPFAVPLRQAGLQGGLRLGMWVNVAPENKVAIVTSQDGKFTTVDYVSSPEGVTILTAIVPTSSLTQAAYSQIPANRRPDAQSAFNQGYVN